MEGIKYANLIELGLVGIEIQGVENGELAVPVNNTLVSHTAFLVADTRPCVLINYKLLVEFYCKKLSTICRLSDMFECKLLISENQSNT